MATDDLEHAITAAAEAVAAQGDLVRSLKSKLKTGEAEKVTNCGIYSIGYVQLRRDPRAARRRGAPGSPAPCIAFLSLIPNAFLPSSCRLRWMSQLPSLRTSRWTKRRLSR